MENIIYASKNLIPDLQISIRVISALSNQFITNFIEKLNNSFATSIPGVEFFNIKPIIV